MRTFLDTFSATAVILGYFVLNSGIPSNILSLYILKIAISAHDCLSPTECSPEPYHPISFSRLLAILTRKLL
jgi:hypothetical protein